MPVPHQNLLAGAAAAAALLTSAVPAAAAPAGTIDTGWNGGAFTPLTFAPTDSADGRHVARFADGSVAVLGVSTVSGTTRPVVARYLADGRPDPAFGSGGRVLVDLPGDDGPAAGIVPLSGGRLLVAGTGQVSGASSDDYLVQRLRADGTVDPNFGSGDGLADGVFRIGLVDKQEQLGAVAVDGDGRLVLVGSTDAGPAQDLLVARITPEGAADTSFSGDGLWRYDSGGPERPSAAVSSGVQLTIGGRLFEAGGAGFVLRINMHSSPTQDIGFGSNGRRLIDEASGSVEVDDLVVLPDRSVRVIGDVSGGASFIEGLTSSGLPDATFLGGERRFTDGAYPAASAAIEALPDGRLVVAGLQQSSATEGKAYVQRLAADGQPDPSFSGDGTALLDGGLPLSAANGLAVEPSGDLLVTGTGGTSVGGLRMVTARVNGSEKPDPAPPAQPGPPAEPGPPAPPAPAPGSAAPVTPPPASKVVPRAADVIALPAARTCVSRRTIALRLRAPKGAKVVSATAKVGGGKARRLTGTQVSLRGLPKGTFKVTVTAKLSTGETLTLKRTYRTCAKKKAKRGR